MNLTEINSILFGGTLLCIKQKDKDKVESSYNFLDKFSRGKIIYGINTGFGPMAQYKINDSDLKALQYNIIRSHSCGAGQALEPIYVKSAMLSRLQTFLNGKSGVHVQLVEILETFINNDIIPFVPCHGSVGASGDLVQLAHIALTLIGEGEVFYKGEKRNTIDVLNALNIKPLQMFIREGLAVTNGTAVMTGIGIVNLINTKKLLDSAIIASVMMNEIAASYDDFMAAELNELKLHKGQNKVAERMRQISSDSLALKKRELELYLGDHKESVFKHKVQPFYSLRCVPQILGPILETIDNTEQILIEEFNSVDDNPIVDQSSNNIYHGGNFHGDYVSFEMDKLKIAVCKLTMLAERQLNYLFNSKINEILPPFVNMGKLGLNYGLQAAQFTASSTTAECQTLANPMYVHSIPNNNDNQDIVSMGTNSALLTKKVIENSFQVMAIHYIAIVQAVDCLKMQDRLSSKTREIYNNIRSIVPCFIDDTPKYKEIELVINYLQNSKNE